MALYTLIGERHAKGEYLTTIARDLKINYKTARKYALADECPMLKAYEPRQRLLTPYEPYLRARWAEGCRNGQQLHREIVAHAFRGTGTLDANYVASWVARKVRGWRSRRSREQAIAYDLHGGDAPPAPPGEMKRRGAGNDRSVARIPSEHRDDDSVHRAVHDDGA